MKLRGAAHNTRANLGPALDILQLEKLSGLEEITKDVKLLLSSVKTGYVFLDLVMT